MSPPVSLPITAVVGRLPPVLRGMLWMLVEVATMASVMVSARALKSDIHPLQMVLMRAAIGFAIVATLTGIGGWRGLRTTRPALHLGRNFVHITGQFLLFLAVTLMPLAQVTALEFTIPLFTALIAATVIGERVGTARWIGMAVGFAGVLLIVRPGISTIQWAALVAICGTFCFGSSNVMVKVLTRTDDARQVVFYMQLMQALMALGPALYVWHTPALSDLPWIALLGIGGISAHYAMTRAIALADVSVVMPVDFLRLPLTAFIAWALWRETLSPWTVIGATLIFGASWWSSRRETRAARQG
jgi:drug/metabolite transporter (DMT)-like permease